MRLTYEYLDERKQAARDRSLGNTLYSTGVDVMGAERRVITEARSLARQMDALANRVEKDGYEASLNSLGEIHSHASFVDSAVGALVAMRESYKRIEKVVFPDDDGGEA